jgi:hypothetical protein
MWHSFNLTRFSPILTESYYYQSILNNTYQFLTRPNNTRQIWYWLVSLGIDKASSIAANMIPVSRKYHHNMVQAFFLSVWYIHDTDSGDFHKTFDAYLLIVKII